MTYEEAKDTLYAMFPEHVHSCFYNDGRVGDDRIELTEIIYSPTKEQQKLLDKGLFPWDLIIDQFGEIEYAMYFQNIVNKPIKSKVLKIKLKNVLISVFELSLWECLKLTAQK